MAGKTGKHLWLLLIILAFAFAYRFLLMTMNTYPPGADIGLHESVINSITSGKTSFFYNYYHMGGGLSVTNPGYHIFAAFIIAMTGAPDYLAQAMVASLFSAFIVLCAFLITKRVWGELAGFVVAVLATFSASDIAILSWSGYPNIVTLMLIPVVFYLFLERSRFSSKTYLAATALVVSAIFLTHIFSAFVFMAVTTFAILACLLARKAGFSVKQALYWLAPIALGALLVSPYLVNIVPVYFGSESTITGTVAIIKQAVMETRLISLGIVCASLVAVCLFFVFSKHENGKFLTVPTILFAAWILVPALATQSYLLGVFLDYERFLYFLALPVIVCIGLVIVRLHDALFDLGYLTQGWVHMKGKYKVPRKTVIALLVSCLVVFILFTPLFATPNVAAEQVKFFQVMNKPEYETIQWINANTPVGSVCVADAEFGWWISGFAKRPTLSAVAPQYLILQHEFEPAKMASNLLEADYLIDNGLVEVKQVGAYASGNTHQVSAILNDSYIHPTIFSINDSQISLLYRQKGISQQLSISAFTESQTSVKNDTDSASFMVTRENEAFNITEEITVYKGVNFAKISLILQNKTANVDFDWLHLPFQARGFPLQSANSVAIVDSTLGQFTQIIFPDDLLSGEVQMQQDPDFYELIFNLNGNSTAEASFFVGNCQFNSDYSVTQADYWNSLLENNSRSYFERVADLPIAYFDYQTALRQWNVSYVVLRDSESAARFLDDPLFSLVYRNSQVSVFKVVKG